MNAQLEAIQSLIRMNREAARELAKVEETTSADFAHINHALAALNEQFHILLQQKEEVEASAAFVTLYGNAGIDPCDRSLETPIVYKEKRGRGAEKQFYLKDESLKPAFIAQLKRIFSDLYTPGKTFRLPDGSEANAPEFLACLHDIGIKHGITSPEAPVYDFSCMIKEAAHECLKDFNTAYNTIQKAVRMWKSFTGNENLYYGINVRFHNLKSEDVPSEYKSAYNRKLRLYTQVEQIYNETKA